MVALLPVPAIAAVARSMCRIGYRSSRGWHAHAGSGSREHPLGDDLAHHLGGPGRDGPQTHVAEEALDGELPHVAVPSVHLDALVGDAVGDLRREELRHRHLANAF